MPKFLLLLLVLTLINACTQTQTGEISVPRGGFNNDLPPPATTLVYECDDFEFVARTGPGELAIWLPDRYLVLSQQRSASGNQYREGDVEFWGKGDEAMLSVAGVRHRNCRVVPERAPWEDARRRGVDLRALGNEPSWVLEIHQQRSVLLVTDYGKNKSYFEQPMLNIEEGLWHYSATRGESVFRADVREQPCSDSMSGVSYPLTVVVQHGGREYRGCGMTLVEQWGE